MELHLKTKFETINRLQGKGTFTVSDLIGILTKIDKNAIVRFGVINGNNTSFVHSDNFIFRLSQEDRDAEYNDEYTLHILTESKIQTP